MRAQDRLSVRAKKEGYQARSIYKLKELDRKYGLFKRGARVLDLGCHPGSWLKYAAERVGDGGLVVGVDLEPPVGSFPGNVDAMVEDVLLLDGGSLKSRYGPFDAVLSDLSPKLTGVRATDMARSLELNEKALEIALHALKPTGLFVSKLFMGEGADDFVKKARKVFKKTVFTKPKASSKRSREMYLLGRGPRG